MRWNHGPSVLAGDDSQSAPAPPIDVAHSPGTAAWTITN
jgi:hypothetical protein